MPPFKQPGETVWCSILFGQLVTAIASITVTPKGRAAEVAPLVIAGQAFSGGEVSFTAAGGTSGELYRIEASVTSGGLPTEGAIEISVEELGWAVPDVSSPYLLASELVGRLGLSEAVRLTDTEGTGRIDAVRLSAAMADATATIHGYLATRYQVPIAPAPADLTGLAFDIAVARLWAGSAQVPERIADNRTAAEAALRDYAKGLRQLPGAETLAPAVTTPAPVLFQPGSGTRFGRDALRGF